MTPRYQRVRPQPDGRNRWNGLSILSSFSERRPLLGIAELARALDLNKSTAHRYIATLANLG